MRPFELTVEDYPPLDPKRWYPLGVRNISRAVGKASEFGVELAHLDPEQAGRVHREVLVLPVRPGNLAAEFFRCLGFAIDVGQIIRPREAVGPRLLARFETDLKTNSLHVLEFKPILEERHDP